MSCSFEAYRVPCTTIRAVREMRGRLDVIARQVRQPISVQGVMITAPPAEPRDYYLLDTTGFVLVRPAMRTSTTLAERVPGRGAGKTCATAFRRARFILVGRGARTLL